MSSGASPSRLTNETNSVTDAEAGNTADPDERELPYPSERVEEFREEYGERARLPLTRTPGQRLRAEMLEEEWETKQVEPVNEWESGHTVDSLVRRTPLTWEAAVEELLDSHEDTRNTMLRLERGYEGDPEHAMLHTQAENSWMRSYQKRYFAELKGWIREAIGGTRPSGGECDGQFENPYLVLLTRTASSMPNGRRRSPVDHIEQIRDAWEPVYHTLRNRLRSLGFDSSDWDYYRKEEPHTSDRGGSVNRCYTHEHLLVVVDGAVTDRDMKPVLDKHVDACDWAGPDAHDLDSITVKRHDEVEDVAAYVASYTGIEPKDLLERSIEYVAWGAAQWAANRKRRSRSNAAGWAATADACKQRYESELSEQEHDHGERIVPSTRRGVDFECAECGSPWGIDQDHQTLTAARRSAGDDAGGAGPAIADGGTVADDSDDELGDLSDLDRSERLRELWPNATGGVTVGRTPSELEKITRIENYLDANPDASISEVLGACLLDPSEKHLIREVLDYVDYDEPASFSRLPDWRLDAVIVHGEEHSVSSGGGVEMAEVVDPVERLLRETRLKYHGDVQAPTIELNVDGERFCTRSAEIAARFLVDHDITEPWHADMNLKFDRRHSEYELANEFQEPITSPPERLS